jgi:hypothetical protein
MARTFSKAVEWGCRCVSRGVIHNDVSSREFRLDRRSHIIVCLSPGVSRNTRELD